MTRMTGPDVSPRHTGPRQDPFSQDPNRPIGSPPPTPYRGASGSIRISEDTILVKRYTATCDECGRGFSHRDRRILLHNLAEHYQRRHGVEAEKRSDLEDVERQLNQISRALERKGSKNY